jgi:glycosyltransferase involved in cell wall biosynthesis
VGGVGRFSDEKGFDTLIEAMDLLPSARLLLVGDGEDRAALEDLVRRRGLEGRVTFTGWLAGRWTLQVGLDVLAVPSRSEGFGLVVIEAMQDGIPVVATEVGGLTEIIRDGENGLLVPPGDPAALAAALGKVLGDAGLRSVLVAQAAETAGHYSLEAMATAFARLYREVSR